MIEFKETSNEGRKYLQIEIDEYWVGYLCIDKDGTWGSRIDGSLESEGLRQIADKLDELNGVSDE